MITTQNHCLFDENNILLLRINYYSHLNVSKIVTKVTHDLKIKTRHIAGNFENCIQSPQQKNNNFTLQLHPNSSKHCLPFMFSLKNILAKRIVFLRASIHGCPKVISTSGHLKWPKFSKLTTFSKATNSSEGFL